MLAKVFLGVLSADSFYLPGVAPATWPSALFSSLSQVEYSDGARVELKVNKLTSVKTQLPYNYYTLPFCQPAGGIVPTVENLGEILAGDVIENSPYDLRMSDNQQCKLLCKQALGQVEKEKFRNKIQDEYLVNMIVDNLPAATKYIRKNDDEYMMMNGFPIGVMKNNKHLRRG